MSLQSLIRKILPKNDIFFTLLQSQSQVLVEACEALTSLIENPSVSSEAKNLQLDHIHELEHRGDKLIQTVLTTLEKNFFAPLDREDVRMLTKKLDDALDELYEVALVFCTYGIITPSPTTIPMMKLLSEAAIALQKSLLALSDNKFEMINEQRSILNALERKSDLLYREAMALLYCDDKTSAKELLRQQAMLFSLESAMNCCHSVSDTLQNVTVKHA